MAEDLPPAPPEWAEDPSNAVLFELEQGWAMFRRDDGFLIASGDTFEEIDQRAKYLGYDLDKVERRKGTPWPSSGQKTPWE